MSVRVISLWQRGFARGSSEPRLSLSGADTTRPTAGSWTCPETRAFCGSATAGPEGLSNGTVSSPPGIVLNEAWQHVAAVVRRGDEETRLYVNGYPVAKGKIGPANLDNPRQDLHLGRVPTSQAFRGELDEVRIYRRALDEAELQALIEPGRRFAQPPPEKAARCDTDSGKPAILRHAAPTRIPGGETRGWTDAGCSPEQRRQGVGADCAHAAVQPTSRSLDFLVHFRIGRRDSACIWGCDAIAAARLTGSGPRKR